MNAAVDDDFEEEGTYNEGEREVGIDGKPVKEDEMDYICSSTSESSCEEFDDNASVPAAANAIVITSFHEEYGREAESNYVCSTPTRRRNSRSSDSESSRIQPSVRSYATSDAYSSSCGLNTIPENNNLVSSRREDDDHSIHSIHTAKISVKSKSSTCLGDKSDRSNRSMASVHANPSTKSSYSEKSANRSVRSTLSNSSVRSDLIDLHSIHTASPGREKSSHNPKKSPSRNTDDSTCERSYASNSLNRFRSRNNPPDVVSFGRSSSRTGSLASQDSLSSAGSLNKFTNNPPSPSRMFRGRSSQKRYIGVPSTVDEDGCESVAREAYVDEVDANDYDPDSAGVEVSLTRNFWRIGRTNSFV